MLLCTFRPDIYNRHGWLGVNNQLSIYLAFYVLHVYTRYLSNRSVVSAGYRLRPLAKFDINWYNYDIYFCSCRYHVRWTTNRRFICHEKLCTLDMEFAHGGGPIVLEVSRHLMPRPCKESHKHYSTGEVRQPIRWNVASHCSPKHTANQIDRYHSACIGLHFAFETTSLVTCYNAPVTSDVINLRCIGLHFVPKSTECYRDVNLILTLCVWNNQSGYVLQCAIFREWRHLSNGLCDWLVWNLVLLVHHLFYWNLGLASTSIVE